MTWTVPTVVVGAGIVGLSIAAALTRRPHAQSAVNTPACLILEAGDTFGTQTSSRNSEVIHAGLYYPAGSLKARLCVEGRDRLYHFARANGIPHRQTGKLILACDQTELAPLDELAAKACANGVDVEPLSASQARALEEQVHCRAALLSPLSGIIDSHALMTALLAIAENGGAELVSKTTVWALSARPSGAIQLHCECQGETVTLEAGRVVVAAGHGSAALMRSLSANGATRAGYQAPRDHPAKGHYYTLSGKSPFDRLIYPVPTGTWLGIHATLDLAGAVRFGPDHDYVDQVDDRFDDADGSRRRRFEEAIARYFPAIRNRQLEAGYVGIRPKIFGPGEAPRDFEVHTACDHGIAGLTALFGIESPGLTAALALGEFVAGLQD